MVMRHEPGTLELKVMEHFRPGSVASSGAVSGEGNIRNGSCVGDHFGIRFRSITFVGGNFGHLKVLSSRIYQSGEQLKLSRRLYNSAPYQTS